MLGKYVSIIENQILRTKKGSRIERYLNKVGKFIDAKIYVHKDYADLVIPNDLLENAKEVLDDSFKYNCVTFDKRTKEVRFDEAKDFDVAREPTVGNFVTIFPDGRAKQGKSQYIWHHKWLWVKDNYKGFDVEKSREWSRLWLSKFDEPASGVMHKWKSQLKTYNLV